LAIRLSILALALSSFALQAEEPFSPSFMAAVEQAFRAPTAEARVAMLSETVRSGTDSEVARAIGVYFPHGVLKTARNDAICTPEIEALLGEMRSAKEQGMDAYFAGSAPAYRALLVEAIACVHTAYSAGIPTQ
jgi:hypothetical protein